MRSGAKPGEMERASSPCTPNPVLRTHGPSQGELKAITGSMWGTGRGKENS